MTIQDLIARFICSLLIFDFNISWTKLIVIYFFSRKLWLIFLTTSRMCISLSYFRNHSTSLTRICIFPELIFNYFFGPDLNRNFFIFWIVRSFFLAIFIDLTYLKIRSIHELILWGSASFSWTFDFWCLHTVNKLYFVFRIFLFTARISPTVPCNIKIISHVYITEPILISIV